MDTTRPEGSFDAFGPSVSLSLSAGGEGESYKEKLETENAQLLREVLTSRRNLDISQTNVATLKALSNQLASQLNAANAEVAILRERRDAADLRSARESEERIAEVRETYERRLEALRKELDEQIDLNTRFGAESQDAHRKADRSFRNIIATKDELIAELTRTVECLQAGLRSNGGGPPSSSHAAGGHGGRRAQHAAAGPTTLSSPRRGAATSGADASYASSSSNTGGGGGGPGRRHSGPTGFDAVAVRNAIIEPTMDLLRLSLRVLKADIATRQTPLGEVNSAFHTSAREPVTRYFVDVQADKHRLDEVPTVDLRVAQANAGKHFSTPQWPRVWKFQTPQGQLVSLTLDICSL